VSEVWAVVAAMMVRDDSAPTPCDAGALSEMVRSANERSRTTPHGAGGKATEEEVAE
jgi:hypothetical protein